MPRYQAELGNEMQNPAFVRQINDHLAGYFRVDSFPPQ
jgi:hypothetical protein